MIQLLRSWEYRSAKQLLFDMGHHEEVVGLNGDGVSKLPPDHDLLFRLRGVSGFLSRAWIKHDTNQL